MDWPSYGILFLELICRRKSFDAKAENENQMVLADWTYDCYIEGNLDQLVKDDKEAKEELERVEKFVKIAIWCIQENPKKRPTMDKVVQMIEGSVLKSQLHQIHPHLDFSVPYPIQMQCHVNEYYRVQLFFFF